MDAFDVAVIGSGPGGYVAAIRCAQLGLKTALIEKYNTLGGTCLNVGCIPSKALLDSSHHYEDATKHFDTHGIEIPGEIIANLSKMVARKDSVVAQTTKGIEFLMDKNKITVLHGFGSFKDAHTIAVKDNDGKTTDISAKNTIIATGSKPSQLPFITQDKERIITSTEAFSPRNSKAFSGYWWRCHWSRIRTGVQEIGCRGNRSGVCRPYYSFYGCVTFKRAH